MIASECYVHNDPRGWTETKSEYKDRKRFVCRTCGRFIGYSLTQAISTTVLYEEIEKDEPSAQSDLFGEQE